MKITLNLASQPYVDLRSVLKRLRLIMLALVAVAIPLFLLLRTEQEKANAATGRVDAVENHVQTLEHQQQSYVSLMRQPQNAAVLEQSDYLNSLFRQKAFSWTATMTDLETVLPGGVQVLSLDPAITKSGQVEIHLRVSGARNRAIELVQNLEKSRHFANTRLAGETQAQGSGGENAGVQPVSDATVVNFDILADYRPLTADEGAGAAKAKTATKSASKNGKLTAHHRRKNTKSVAKKPEAK
ncbi:MAG TPA: PilN domain-containing protein [Silvibacterium sp.]|nr:PilN domain-containing protein [Silvibacterium sp.]